MEKFLMCFINGKRQIIELKRHAQEKRARRMATRPEPTIIGNCDSWNFIVGKKLVPMSPIPRIHSTLPHRNKHFIHKLFTVNRRAGWDNLWASCGSAVNCSAAFHNMAEAIFDMSISIEQSSLFYPID
jgi:hypothetical protein